VRQEVTIRLVLVLVLQAAPAWAQSDATRAAARNLGMAGVEAFQSGNYVVANEKLGRAFEILRAPSLGLWSARALAAVGKLVEASERYLAVARLDVRGGDASVQEQAKADAAKEREALLSRIPNLIVDAKRAPDDASFTMDGVPFVAALLSVKQPANPGRHVVEGRSGEFVVKKEITLREGQDQTLLLDFSKAPQGSAAASSRPSSVTPPEGGPAADGDVGQRGLPAGFWVGIAVAAAGAVTGGVSAGLAAQKRSDLDCPGNVCGREHQDEVDGYNMLLTVSTVGFVVAGVGAAGATIFFLSRPKPSEQAGVRPYVGPASVGVVGAF
jgi:hypothetical protein